MRARTGQRSAGSERNRRGQVHSPPAAHPLHVLQREVGNTATAVFVQRLKLANDMSPHSVEAAVANRRNDPTKAVEKHDWVQKDAYVSNWDHPNAAKGGRGDAWGFSTAHWLSSASQWVIHVHRRASGQMSDKRSATVQEASLEGVGGEKPKLTSPQLERIGVPTTAEPTRYVGRRWRSLGRPGW